MPRKESKEDKKCNKCNSKMHMGNDPSWYTREGLNGMVGANFAALSTVNPIDIGNSKVRTNTGISFDTLVGCPSDKNGSFMKMMTLMYAEIREKNSGAANYNPKILGSYVHDIMTLRALYIHACRNIAAVRASQPGNGDSPYYLAGVVSQYSYRDIADNLANYSNALKLIGKDMSVLPIPKLAMFDREEFLYGRVFADSKTNKASFMAFVPSSYIRRINISGNDYVYTVVQKQLPTSMNALITEMQDMLMNITTNPVISILRGDLIKAFGYSGVDMSQYVDRPVTIEYNRTVLSQIENMNILFNDLIIEEDTGKTGNLYLKMDTSLLEIPQRASDTAWMINFHDGMTPDSGTLLAITRNMVYSDVDGAHTSGDPVLYVRYITAVNSAAQTVTYGDLMDAINNIQSTTQTEAENGLREVANIASIVDGFPWVWTGTGAERNAGSYIWDVDQWAIINTTQLEQMNEQCIRSLFYYRAPRVDGMIKPGAL